MGAIGWKKNNIFKIVLLSKCDLKCMYLVYVYVVNIIYYKYIHVTGRIEIYKLKYM